MKNLFHKKQVFLLFILSIALDFPVGSLSYQYRMLSNPSKKFFNLLAPAVATELGTKKESGSYNVELEDEAISHRFEELDGFVDYDNILFLKEIVSEKINIFIFNLLTNTEDLYKEFTYLDDIPDILKKNTDHLISSDEILEIIMLK